MDNLREKERRAIIIVTDTARGGAPSRLATLARGLRERGWNILFISLLPEADIALELRREGFAIRTLNLTSWTGLPRALIELRRTIARFQPLVVQTALWHANLLGRLCAIGTGIPVINGHESVDDDRPVVRDIVDLATARLAAAHTAVADAVAERISIRNRISREEIHVIPVAKDWDEWVPRGARDEVRRSLGIPVEARVIVWSGRLHAVKNLDLLLQALMCLPDWWLLIIGDGPERGRLEDRAHSNRVIERVRFTGEVSDVSRWLEAGDVFCLVSRWEGLPTALMEAMAMGLPVVAPDVGGIPELITDCVTGHLIAAQDAQEIATGILAAADNPDLGKAAAASIRERFRQENMIRRHDHLWSSVSRDRR